MSDMVKVEVSKLQGAALDWAVATAEGRAPTFNMESHGSTWAGWWLRLGGEYERMPSYSTDWKQGGPIIERTGITTRCIGHDINGLLWDASSYAGDEEIEGPTPLIAAMRCYVTSRFGNTMEIPAVLAPAPSAERRARP